MKVHLNRDGKPMPGAIFKIKIIKASKITYWYANKIGRVYNVVHLWSDADVVLFNDKSCTIMEDDYKKIKAFGNKNRTLFSMKSSCPDMGGDILNTFLLSGLIALVFWGAIFLIFNYIL